MASSSNDTGHAVEREFVPKDAISARVVDTMQLDLDAAASATWTFVSLTQDVAQIALDAVRYQRNYARTVTSRLCLHYINTIRKRVSSGLTNYLFNVDGCASSLLEATGPLRYLLLQAVHVRVAVNAEIVGGDIFIVQSIYKTVDQKTLDGFRAEESNLDWSTDVEAGIEEQPVSSPLETSAQSEQTMAGQSTGKEELKLPTDDDGTIAWASTEIIENNFWQPPPLVTQQAASEPLSLRVEPVTMASLKTEIANTAEPADSTIVAMVSVSTIAVVVALIVIKLRARVNAVKRAVNQAYPPLRSAEPISVSTTETVVWTEST
ncbi:hypothetical protein PRIC1_001379 [Phytophthora ramorum]